MVTGFLKVFLCKQKIGAQQSRHTFSDRKMLRKNFKHAESALKGYSKEEQRYSGYLEGERGEGGRDDIH
jgi:hypothetical protein